MKSPGKLKKRKQPFADLCEANNEMQDFIKEMSGMRAKKSSGLR